MSYTMYTPLNVWLDPASVTDVVAYIQTYLSENTIYSETEIEAIIHDYLIAHPELIGGVQSVNGKTGTVVLSASDINTENNVTIESVLASLSSQISSIASSVATNTANITNLTGRMTTAETDLTNLKSSVDELYENIIIDDMYGENASVVRTDNLISATWDGGTKTVTVTMSGTSSSADNYYALLSPKLIANHTYKIAIKYLYQNGSAYTYIRNVFNLWNYNNRDDLVNGTIKYNNDEEVLTLSATSDGWLALGTRVPADVQRNWVWKLAVYDVTNIDISGVTDSKFLSFADTIIVGADGIVKQIQAKVEYIYPLVRNVKGETWTALGDSLTAQGSGSQYIDYVKSKLGLANYYNCGIGGTSISGATNANAMYQNVRINALNINSNCITIMGGTNDIWQQYYKDNPNTNYTGWGDCTRDNYDVSTFCGAYNVLISKVLYKFCLVPAYYSNIDYTGIMQASAAIDNFRLILITPPQAFHVEGDTASASLLLNGITAAHSYVKQIAELWSLPCVDSWEMGMNDINKPLFFANYLTDATHFNAFGHERLSSLIIDKALQVSRYN